ncbi:MAG: hypothetical protein ABIJ42_01645 [Acidobacteriota bacterium]
MRSGKAVFLILLFFTFAPWARGQSFFPTEFELDSFQQSYRYVDIRNLDVSGLLKEVGHPHPGLSEEDTSLLIRRNVSYIIFHKLNRDRLFIAPDGQYIVDRATEIYESLNRIEELISEGKVLSARELKGPEHLKILRELRNTARTLRKKFKQYFIELRNADYEFQIRPQENSRQVMSDYLEECRKVNTQLKFSLDRFFCNLTPGVVTVNDYNSYSVALLSHSLEVMSDSFAQSLGN